MTILSSASRLVFLLLTITACIGFILHLLPVDQFMLLCVAAFSYYFAKPTDKELNATTITTPSSSTVDTSVTTTPTSVTGSVNTDNPE